VGWLIYKLTKNDTATLAHQDFSIMKAYLDALSHEKIEYKQDIRNKITHVVPGPEIIRYMSYLESLVLQLFEQNAEFGPDILIHIE
jgi:hypothetical protein